MSMTFSKRPRSLSLPQIESSMTLAGRLRRRAYQYEQLQNLDSDIRILKLLPSGEANEVHCSLQTFSLDEKPFYIAASYEWGKPEPLVDIRIDGKRFGIRHNLFLFLHYLQTDKPDLVSSGHVRLWVDAICIDQGNLIEKTSQVRNMSRIFTQADSVFAWLGWTTHFDTKTTFHFIRESSSEGQLVLPKSDNEISPWYEKFVHSDTGTSHFYDVPLAKMWKGVVQLSSLSYWSRRWIIQEVLLAREVTMVFDGQELPWTAFKLLFGLLDRQRLCISDKNIMQVLAELEQTIPWKLWRHTVKRAKPAEDKVTLRSLLEDFRPTVCTVAYDRVYALLSLSKDGHFVPIDYSCPMIDVFIRVILLGANDLLDIHNIARLAAELGLSSEPERNHNAASFGPFVKYSRKLSNLVRVIDVNSEWDEAIEFAQLFGRVGEEFCSAHVHHLRESRERHPHLTFDTNLVHSRVEHSLGQNALLKDGTELPIHERKRNLSTLTSAGISPSKSDDWTYIVCDDGGIGWSCSSVLPGDFLWPVCQRVSLVLRFHEGVFTIVGAASTTKLGPPLQHIEIVMSCLQHKADTKHQREYLEDMYLEEDEESEQDEDLEQEKCVTVPRRYCTSMMDLWEGAFNYTWVLQRSSVIRIPSEVIRIPSEVIRTPSELIEAAFVWRSWEGGRVRLFTIYSSLDDPDLAKARELGFACESEPTSSIDIFFDAWELMTFAQKFEWLDEIGVGLEEEGPLR